MGWAGPTGGGGEVGVACSSAAKRRIPVVLAAVDLKARRVHSARALVFLWYAEPKSRLEPMRHVQQRTRELGVVVHHQHVRNDPVTRPEGHLEDDPSRVTVSVARVGTVTA
jgi:hypothetical protein